ncbi:MAG: hypothetical protein ACP5P1_02970 [Acidimicrobiales bacterium]
MFTGGCSAWATICSAAVTAEEAPPLDAVVPEDPDAVVAELDAVVAELVDVFDELQADSAPPIVIKATPAVRLRVSFDRC